MYEKIAAQMKEAGYDRLADQCTEKAKKLKGDYRKSKASEGKLGLDVPIGNFCMYLVTSWEIALPLSLL